MRLLCLCVLTLAVCAQALLAVSLGGDLSRPVCQLGNTSVTLQWYTRTPCETRVQMRMGGAPCMTPQPSGSVATAWSSPTIWTIDGPSGKRTYHRLQIKGLLPSTRYYYRLYDPDVAPTAEERAWGAAGPWRREYAINTRAVPGRRTVLRVPVKVLIMPNVINVSSAFDRTRGQIAPEPTALNRAEIEKIKNEYRMAARFLFINSGFRMWHDFQFFVDERWQRWSDEPAAATGFFKNLPPCRSWTGEDYTPPGGGTFTPFDSENIETPGRYPLFEKELYVGQIENALVRFWDARLQRWEFKRSGGGTLGVDGWPQGVPGRSQFLGDDIAWLATHEYHHQIESQGFFSGLNTEDDRIFYCHFSERYRRRQPDGSYDENVWASAGRFGEHWSGIAHTDREISEIQWLRWYFGEPIAVDDYDRDGVPDNHPALPFDEARFGSDPRNARSDGQITDFAKILLSIWSGGPLQSMWTRPERTGILPRPFHADSDRDGIADADDPEPLVPFPPFVWPGRATLDGDVSEWAALPLCGRIDAPEGDVVFTHSHDDAAYYGLVAMNGAWRDVRITLDGEGDGVWGPGVGGFGGSADGFWITIKAPTASYQTAQVSCERSTNGFSYVVHQDGAKTVVEFAIGNRGNSPWYWTGGGRTIGVAIDAGFQSGARYAMFDGYELVYCTMLPLIGKQAPPVPPPAPLAATNANRAAVFTAPAATRGWQFDPAQWLVTNGALRFAGNDGTFLADGFHTTNFQIWVEFEAERDLVLGAFRAASAHIDPGVDYIAFAGGYNNTLSKIRIAGRGEVAGDAFALSPGRHTMQFTRRDSIFYFQVDDALVGWYADTDTPLIINRLGVVGIPDAGVRLYQLRVRGD